MSRSLATRTAIGASALALVGMLVMMGTARLSLEMFGRPLDDWSLPPADRAACEADPEHWSQALLDVGVVWAYDLEGRSRNPDAPLLEPAFAAEMRDSVTSWTDETRTRAVGRRVADGGDCALVTLRMRPPGTLATALSIGLLLGVTAGLLAVATLVLAFVPRPLQRRIARLREAARHVGAHSFAVEEDSEQDELGEIRTVLNHTHARILTDAAALRERSEALERHLADVAHDLRTPLASLLLALQEVESALDPAVPRDPMARALGDAESVAGLVDNLHQGTRLRQNIDVGVEQADLTEVVSRLQVRFAALGRLRSISVGTACPDEPVWIACSPPLAERAIANLIHNAVNHGHSGGHVAILLDANKERFSLTIVDDGPGLSPAVRASLHAATFHHDPARPRDGGLGSAITAEVARRAGWELRYEDAEPGLRVTVSGAVA